MNTKSTKQFVSFLFENVKRTEQFEANKNKLKKLEARLIELENLAEKIKDDADEQRRGYGKFDSYMINSKEEIELTKIDDERRNIEAKIENINKEQENLEKIPADQPTKGEIERSGSTTARGKRLPKVNESKNRFRSTKQFISFLLENIRQTEETTLSVAKKLLGENPYLKNKAESLTKEDLIEMGNYVFLKFPDTFQHTARHFSGTEGNDKIPGSKFSPEYSDESKLIELIEKIVQTAPTQENTIEGPTVKDKWINYDVGEVIGKDSVMLASDVKEKNPNAKLNDADANELIGRNAAIEAIVKSGNNVAKLNSDETLTPISTPEDIAAASKDTEGKYVIVQKIKSVNAPKKDTKVVTLVLADLGLGKVKTPDGKKIVSLVTFFPGFDYGFKSKEEYSKNGYVFLTGSISESRLYLSRRNRPYREF